jgi:hypothetical protein
LAKGIIPTPATITLDDIGSSANYPLDIICPMGHIWR